MFGLGKEGLGSFFPIVHSLVGFVLHGIPNFDLRGRKKVSEVRVNSRKSQTCGVLKSDFF